MPHLRCLCLAVLAVLAACSGSDRTSVLTPPQAAEDINARFKDPGADPQRWVERFEGESREIFVHRAEIAAAAGLAPGERVADVGAGTGLFLALFAEKVGETGKVFAVDISPSLVSYMRRRLAETGLSNVEVVHSVETSTTLAEDVVDVVFVCDTYHHFTYYSQMLASIHGALAGGGRLIVVDFERQPGTSRDWILNHVRAGKAEVIDEVEAAGFVFEEEIEIAGLAENYVLRFVKPRPAEGRSLPADRARGHRR